MKSEKERREHWLVVAAIGGGGLVLFLLVRRVPTSAPSPARSPATATHFAPNPANPQLEQSIITAREAALATYDQSAVAERAAADQVIINNANDITAQAINANNQATQLKETGIASAAYEAIAAEEARVQQQAIAAQQAVASQYASAQQTQAQGGFWGSLLGGIGGLFGMVAPFLGI